jgi:CBS domain-containing protein
LQVRSGTLAKSCWLVIIRKSGFSHAPVIGAARNPQATTRRKRHAAACTGLKDFGIRDSRPPVPGTGKGRSSMTTVREILALKGRDVVTIEPGATIGQAVRLMAERRIGAVVITGANRTVVGILSERDIVRQLAAHGPEMLADPVSTLMTRNVVTCAMDQTAAELMEMMTDGKFRHLPVIEKGQLVAIISIGDVVKSRIAETEQESRALRDYILTA